MSEEIEIGIDEVVNVKPTLYDINKSFNVIKTDNYSGLVGEEEARMVIFTNFILGEKPCILKGSRASGKTNTIRVVSKYAKKPIDIASSSEKANQRNEKLNDYSHFIIPEINKVNDKTIEMLKDFGEGEKHLYSYLNAFKESETIEIDPKAFITSIADENKQVGNLGEELLSRVTVVRTDSSVKQNVDVIKEKLQRAANPNYKKETSQEEVSKFVAYVQNLPSIKEFKFVYPAGEAMRTAIPPLFTDSRRDVGKYLANTYGITLFHYHDRTKASIGDDKYLFVTPADMWYNHVIYQDILLESSLKCGKIEQKIIEVLKDENNHTSNSEWGENISGLKISDIHTQLLKSAYTPTIDSVRKMCDGLMEVGYVTRNEEVRPYRYEINPQLNRDYDVSVDWKSIVSKCAENMRDNFPDLAEEYISSYCEGEGLVVVHPFTGETIDISDSFKEDDKSVLHVEPDKKEEESVSIDELKKEQEELKKSVLKEGEKELHDDWDGDSGDGSSINIDEFSLDTEDEEDGVVSAESVDSQDSLQDSMLELLSEQEMEVHELAEALDIKQVNVERMLSYLTRINEVMEVKAGRYKRL